MHVTAPLLAYLALTEQDKKAELAMWILISYYTRRYVQAMVIHISGQASPYRQPEPFETLSGQAPHVGAAAPHGDAVGVYI